MNLHDLDQTPNDPHYLMNFSSQEEIEHLLNGETPDLTDVDIRVGPTEDDELRTSKFQEQTNDNKKMLESQL